MDTLNKLLLRQIKRNQLNPDEIPEDMMRLLKAISNSYDHYENDRELIERSIELSSQELMEAKTKLHKEYEAQKRVLENLKELLIELGPTEIDNNGFFDEDDVVIISNFIRKEIHRRKDAEDRLVQSEYRFRSLIQNISDSITTIDQNGIITYQSPSIERILGYTVDEFIGNSIFSYMHPDDREHVNTSLMSVLNKRGVFAPFEFRIRNKAGKYIFVESIGNNLLYDPSVNGIVIISRDTTARRKQQEELIKSKEIAESATKAKSNFLAMMSHEIRTPLNGVIGMTGLLMETDLTEQQKDFIDTIRLSGDALLSVINDILDFSKIESGKMDLEEMPFEVRMCVEDALDLLSRKAQEKKLHLLYYFEGSVPRRIKSDMTRLRQILVNLISNAVKFTEKGEIIIRIASKHLSESRYELTFSVKDSGIGISEEKLHKLFQPFSQVDSSTTRRFGGTGLGLAICHKLTELLGGRIWVESTKGTGSVFHFTIVADGVADETNDITEEDFSSIQGKRVLIVDNNPDPDSILTMQLQQWGMRLKTSTSMQESIEWIDFGVPFDLLIINMSCPKTDGFDFLNKVREYKSPIELPAILLIPADNECTTEIIGNQQISAIITKPLKHSQLFDTLMNIFSDKSFSSLRKVFQKQLNEKLSENFPLRILIAEDNSINQKLAVAIFARMGYLVDVAGNGLEVLDAMKQKEFDIIFMDLQMPEMDGIETTAEIIKLYPESRPKIIAMTANTFAGDREICIEAGMDDYISKPVQLQNIQNALKKWGSQISPKHPVISHSKQQINSSFLDSTVYQRFCDLDKDSGCELYKELMHQFFIQLPNDAANISKLAHSERTKELTKVVHSLKGASLSIGADKIATICQSIEKSIIQGSPTKETSVLIEQLKEASVHTKKEYYNFLLLIEQKN